MGEPPSRVPVTDGSPPGTSPPQAASRASKPYLSFRARRGPRDGAGIANQRYADIEKTAIPTSGGIINTFLCEEVSGSDPKN